MRWSAASRFERFLPFLECKEGLDYRVRPHHRWRVDPRDRSSIPELNSDREIVAIDIKGDVNVLGVQIRSGRIVEAPDFAPSEHKPTNGFRITQPCLLADSEGGLRRVRPRRFASLHSCPWETGRFDRVNLSVGLGRSPLL